MDMINTMTPFTIAAFSTAPGWSIIAMFVILIVLIVLLHRELWALFTKMATAVVLFVLLVIFSILGGLLPQHYTQEEAARNLIKLIPPENITLEGASQLMELPHPGEIPTLMLARQWKYPGPDEITLHEAIEIMGEEPAKGVSVQNAYSGWLRREYNRLLIDAYGEWYAERYPQQLEAASERFKETYKLDLFETFYEIGFFRIFHTWYFLLTVYLFFITVICCSINRLPGYLKKRNREPAAMSVDGLKRRSEVEEFDFEQGELVDADKAAEILKRKGLRPKACKKEGEGYQFELNFGFPLPHVLTSVIFHFGIFVAILGFLATGYYSWKTEVEFDQQGASHKINHVNPDMKMYKVLSNIHENRGWGWANPEKYFDMDESFQLRCDDYFVEYIPNDDDWYDIRDWKTKLVVVDDGKDVKEQLIEVNFPLTYHGIDFYQQNYEQHGMIDITAPDGRTSTAFAEPGRIRTPGIAELDQRLYCSGLVHGKLVEKGKEPVDLGPMARLGEVLPPKVEHWPDPGKSAGGKDTNPKAQAMIEGHLQEHGMEAGVAHEITEATLKYLDTKDDDVSDLDAYLVVFNDLQAELGVGPDEAAEIAGVMLYLWRVGDDEGMGGEMKGMPEFGWLMLLEDGKPATWKGYTFKLRGPYSASTGIEVRRDPGVPILWVSIIIVMAMMVLRIYFPRYTARVDVAPGAAGGSHMVIAGRAYGLAANFRKRAKKIVRILKVK